MEQEEAETVAARGIGDKSIATFGAGAPNDNKTSRAPPMKRPRMVKCIIKGATTIRIDKLACWLLAY